LTPAVTGEPRSNRHYHLNGSGILLLLLCISIGGEGGSDGKLHYNSDKRELLAFSSRSRSLCAYSRARLYRSTEMRLGAGHLSWHWMLPATLGGLPEGHN
jgi:hypothetical protein